MSDTEGGIHFSRVFHDKIGSSKAASHAKHVDFGVEEENLEEKHGKLKGIFVRFAQGCRTNDYGRKWWSYRW